MMMKRIPSNLTNQFNASKIFVGGLSWNTTKEMLFSEFSQYGEIIDSIVMKNPETGNSRGFGFITYKTNDEAQTAVASGEHNIDGKTIDVKLCSPRSPTQQRAPRPQKNENCKVFVGGLPHGVTDEQIKQFFSRYGMVKEFKMMFDEAKQRPRGFGFITFELEDSANQVLQEHYIQFNGKQIEVKPQIHNQKPGFPSSPYAGQSMGGGIAASGVQYQSGGVLVGYNPAGSQQWGGYQAQAAAQPSIPAYNNPQGNWNYNYYGQQQQQQQQQQAPQTGYYQAEESGGEKMQGYQNYRQNKGGDDRGYQNRGGNRSNYQQNGDGQQRYQRGNNPNYNNQRAQSTDAYQAPMDEYGQPQPQQQTGSSPNNGRQSSSYHPYRR